jgi:hypothetical protein
VDRRVPETVYVVIISGGDGAANKVGAVYLDEQEARDEVARLQSANPWTKATYVSRQIGEKDDTEES